MRQDIFEPEPARMDVEGNLGDAEPGESQEHHGVIGVIREHHGDSVAGTDAKSREPACDVSHAGVKVGERDGGAAEEAKRLRGGVTRAALDQLRERFHVATVTDAGFENFLPESSEPSKEYGYHGPEKNSKPDSDHDRRYESCRRPPA